MPTERRRRSTNPLTYLAVVLAIVGILWTAAEQWGDMKARIKTLEMGQTFYHGDLPKEGINR